MSPDQLDDLFRGSPGGGRFRSGKVTAQPYWLRGRHDDDLLRRIRILHRASKTTSPWWTQPPGLDCLTSGGSRHQGRSARASWHEGSQLLMIRKTVGLMASTTLHLPPETTPRQVLTQTYVPRRHSHF
jgi:hypothetical protein